MNKQGKRTFVKVSLVILVGAGIIYWAFFLREHHRWNEDLRLWNGGTLHVQQHMSRKAYHGLVGHASPFWWGGGDRWYEMQFTIGENKYRWEGPHTPIAIQADEDGTVYIVAFDRESEEAMPRRHSHPMFRIYRSHNDDSWAEITPKEFPRHLAIQNRQCASFSDGSDDDRSNVLAVIERMNPAELEFRSSLNGELWVFLEDPSGKALDGTPSVDFAREFKAKWIRPIAPVNQTAHPVSQPSNP
jgi:hypothetical protein